MPERPPIAQSDREAVLGAIADWFAWCKNLVHQPPGEAWGPEQMEYGFVVSASLSDAEEVALRAPEHFEGRLDWYTFEHHTPPSQPDPPDPLPPTKALKSAVLPAPVTYPGMPALRWWEIEDARVNFGSVEAGPPDLMRLLFVEFASVFCNDWFTIPIDGVPVGSLSRITSLVTRDTFGEETTVEPFPETELGEAWRMFQLASSNDTVAPNLLFLPPTVATNLESPPLEEVVFLRDELANMAWAVERTVESQIGRPLRRHEAYEECRRRIEAGREGEPSVVSTSELTYRLMTEVPPYWIPFRPDEVGSEQRRGFIRTRMRGLRTDCSYGPVDPAGKILMDETFLEIYDENIPREGVSVTRSWQLTRDLSGHTHLWLGRRKRPGRGEGSSGLRFDNVESSKPTEG